MIWMAFTDHMGEAVPALHECRVLLVEDDYLVGLSMRSILEQLGCEVVGPVASLSKALRMVEDDLPDAAVLDINILGGTSVPIAERLRDHERPFIFVSGYQSPRHMLPEMLQKVQRLAKPVDERSLRLALHDAMG